MAIGSNYEAQLSQQVQDLLAKADEKLKEIQKKIQAINAELGKQSISLLSPTLYTSLSRSNFSLDKTSKENQAKFEKNTKPLLSKAAQKISDKPEEVSVASLPKIAKLNPKLKDSLNQLLNGAQVPDEMKAMRVEGHEKPEDFPAVLAENPEFKDIELSEDSKTEEDPTISDEEHSYEVSSLAATPEPSHKDSSDSHSGSSRSKSTPPQEAAPLQPGFHGFQEGDLAYSERRGMTEEEKEEMSEERQLEGSSEGGTSGSGRRLEDPRDGSGNFLGVGGFDPRSK